MYETQHSTAEDMSYCLRWMPWDPEDVGPAAALFAVAYQTNVRRAAEAVGPALIARLVKAGLLEPEGDPVEALEDLIEGASCA